MLRLSGGQVESLFDQGLPVEVRELPADLAALDGLLGDPALTFGNPKTKVVLDSIDGEHVNGEQMLNAGSRIRISGHIETGEGETDMQFNGTIFFRLYDSKGTITTKGNTGDTPFTYTAWNKELGNGSDSVQNGRFSSTIIIPKDINYSDENGRFVFYAVNKDLSTEANGSNEDFLVGGYSEKINTDSVGPDIFIYLNDEDFQDGDAVNSKPVFVAELHDESGIQYNGNGIGHDLQLCIDGDPKKTYNLNGYYTQKTGDYTGGIVSFADMPELEPGAHWLSFRSWDMLNNTSVKTVKFVVGKNIEPEVLSLMMEEDIVSGHTNFHIGYNFPSLTCQFSLEIFSTNGMLQWKKEFDAADENGVVSIPWNGHNGAGASLNNGIYICRVTASYNGSKKSQKEKKFIFRGNK